MVDTVLDSLADVPELSVDDMLQTSDVDYKYIDMRPMGWPGKARIGSLTANDLIEWNEANEGLAKRTAGLRLLVKSLVDKDGKRIGKDEHLEQFKKKSHKATDHLTRKILDHNGMAVKSDKDTLKVVILAVKELEDGTDTNRKVAAAKLRAHFKLDDDDVKNG